jgi:hypothetical protein
MKKISHIDSDEYSKNSKSGSKRSKVIILLISAVFASGLAGSFVTLQLNGGLASQPVVSHPKGNYQVKMIPLINRADTLMLIVGGLADLSPTDQRSAISSISGKWSEIQADCKQIKPETADLVAAHDIYSDYLAKTHLFFQAALEYLDTGNRSKIKLMSQYQSESDLLQTQYDSKIASIHDPGSDD